MFPGHCMIRFNLVESFGLYKFDARSCPSPGKERRNPLTDFLWILLAPVLFVGPGLLPARIVAGPGITAWTLVWSFFFSVVLLPTLAFGLAMLLGTTANAYLVVPLAVVLGVLGMIFPRKRKETQAG